MRSFLGFQNILSCLLFKSQEKRKDIGQNSKKNHFPPTQNFKYHVYHNRKSCITKDIIKMKNLKRLLMMALLALVCTIPSMAGNKGKVIKILAIGNSFSQDAIENYLHQLADSAGVKTIIANMYIGGCSLERHYNNAKDDKPAYSYRKITIDGKKTEYRSTTLDSALTDEKWDYVSFQQASPLSGKYDTFSPYLSYLIKYVKERVPAHTKLLWHQTWAYAEGCKLSGFANYNRDQLTMYHAIVEASKKAKKDYKLYKIVPVGTAIQNARTSFIGDNMNRDKQHLEVHYGRYTAACTWLEAVLGINPIGNKFVPKGVDDAHKDIAQKAAHAACKKPNSISTIK